MISTTATKKELIDFLWDWANQDWSKLLVSIIVQKEQELSKEERENVFNYFLQSIKLKKSLPDLNISKPTFTPQTKHVSLLSLSEVTGVNNLAEKQTINFSKHLTVIYGDNGTGKTGYGRILKALGFSYEQKTSIYPNIYNSKIPLKGALIRYSTSQKENSYTWGENTTSTDLQTISVFNNNCVHLSLGNGRELIVKPMGFHLFNIITNELSELMKILDDRISKVPIQNIWIDCLNPGTVQHNYIGILSKDSNEDLLDQLSSFTEADGKILAQNEEEIKNLNKALLDSNIKELNAQIAELNNLLTKVLTSEKNLTSKDWIEFNQLTEKIDILEKKEKVGISNIAELKGIEFYQSKEFLTFLKAADNYIKILNRSNYPNDEKDSCIYCRQELTDDGAKELLTNYRSLLNDTTQEEIKECNNKKAEIVKKVKILDGSLLFHQATFGSIQNTQNNEVIQPEEIKKYNKEISSYKEAILSDKVDNSTFSLDYPAYTKFFTDKKSLLEKTLADKNALLRNITSAEQSLKAKINEIKDRKYLSNKVDEIKKVIKNKKIISILEANRNSFKTNSISSKTSQASEELLNQDFVNNFEKELSVFKKSNIKINLSFGTTKGQSKINQLISGYNLTDILSEGEQKAIALAEFLTELQLDHSKSPVIFDDPVNSLDHHIIDDVSKRLVLLSKDRQVIVFTHNILLFNSFIQQCNLPFNKEVEHEFYNVRTEYGICGYIEKAKDEINKITHYIGLINNLTSNPPKDRKESEVASEGYGHLRSAMELLIEQGIFQQTVKRYQRNVAVTNFAKVNGQLIDQHKQKIYDVFDRCSGYISGHSNPTEIHKEPTIEELKKDFQEFGDLKKQFGM